MKFQILQEVNTNSYTSDSCKDKFFFLRFFFHLFSISLYNLQQILVILRHICSYISDLSGKRETSIWPLIKTNTPSYHSHSTTPVQYEQALKAPNTTRCYSHKYKMDMDKLLKAITLKTIMKKMFSL